MYIKVFIKHNLEGAATIFNKMLIIGRLLLGFGVGYCNQVRLCGCQCFQIWLYEYGEIFMIKLFLTFLLFYYYYFQ